MISIPTPRAYEGMMTHASSHRPRDEDDARDTFKALKNQHIGDGHASLYHQWAQLEASSGNTSKALAVIQKGLKERAEPARYGLANFGARPWVMTDAISLNA